MGDRISKNIIFVIITLIASIITIVVFLTDVFPPKDPPNGIEVSTSNPDQQNSTTEDNNHDFIVDTDNSTITDISNKLPANETDAPISNQDEQNSPTEDNNIGFYEGDDANIADVNTMGNSAAKQITRYELDGTVAHLPDTMSGDYVIGGVWKLQGIHEAAYSFTQRVEVYSLASPDQILYYGAASYDMEWAECDDGTYAEVPSDFDQITQYDYPSGTYGTFRVDLSSPPITSGEYECRLVLYINEVCYTYSIPFEI